MMSGMSTPAEWGPSHQTDRRWRLTFASASLLALAAVQLFVSPSAIVMGALFAAWVLLIGVPVVLRRVGLSRRQLIATLVNRSDDPLAAVRSLFAQRGDVYLG